MKLTTHPDLAPRLEQELSYASTPHLSLHIITGQTLSVPLVVSGFQLMDKSHTKFNIIMS